MTEHKKWLHQRFTVACNADFPCKRKLGKLPLQKKKKRHYKSRGRRFWPQKKTKSKLSDSISSSLSENALLRLNFFNKTHRLTPHSLCLNQIRTPLAISAIAQSCLTLLYKKSKTIHRLHYLTPLLASLGYFYEILYVTEKKKRS